MNYSTYASVKDLIDAVKSPSDWEETMRKHEVDRGKSYGIRYMRSCIKDIVEGNNGGDTVKLQTAIDATFGDHSYESSLTSEVESNINSSNEYYKEKFKFVNRQTSGGRVDVQRFLNGDPRCWFDVRKRKAETRAVRVFAPMGGVWDVTTEMMRVCGALSCAVSEILESNGISVELWASCICNGTIGKCGSGCSRLHGSEASLCQLVKVKDASQYCDYGMINYVTGDSQFYRSVVWADRILYGVKSLANDKYFCSYGSSTDFDRSCIPPDEDHDADYDIVVPRIYTIEDARKWLNEDFNEMMDNMGEEKND